LAATIAPNLSDYPSGDVKHPVMLDCQFHQAKHEPVSALEGDQGAGVEDYRPRT
jgi:hypothetical protein